MKILVNCLAVGGAGFFGAVLRYLVALGSARLFGAAFPVGTFIVNISGSLFLGWFLTTATQRGNVSEGLRLALATGFVGAYTTFSTFVYESDALLSNGAFLRAGVNLIGSVAAGLIAVRLGILLAAR